MLISCDSMMLSLQLLISTGRVPCVLLRPVLFVNQNQLVASSIILIRIYVRTRIPKDLNTVHVFFSIADPKLLFSDLDQSRRIILDPDLEPTLFIITGTGRIRIRICISLRIEILTVNFIIKIHLLRKKCSIFNCISLPRGLIINDNLGSGRSLRIRILLIRS